MDIYTAAHYMKSGYRIRRSHWRDNEYLQIAYNNVVEANVRCLHPSSPDTFERHSWTARIEDLLSNDWELITEGIIKYFPVTYKD